MEKEKRTITAKRQQRGLTVTHVRTLEFSPEDIVRKTSELTNQITQLEFHIGQWNTIALGSSQLGRIDATVFIQALMGVI